MDTDKSQSTSLFEDGKRKLMGPLKLEGDLFVKFALGEPVRGLLDLFLFVGQVEIHVYTSENLLFPSKEKDVR
jgi:hypothetical protein